MVKEGRESDISVLGEDSLVEILCRLGSAKYAIQCKSVCKLWCSLVNTDSHSHWLRRWIQMNHNNESVTFIVETDHRHKETPTSCVNLNFLPCFNGREQVHVVGSHKDLLLCCPNYYDRCSSYYICNPLTKQWTALPPPPPPPTNAEPRFVNKITQVEFIVDEQKFTVVRIIPDHVQYVPGPPPAPEEKVQVSIFSSDVGWRETGAGGEWREMFLARRSCKKIVSYNGSLVWLMKKECAEEVRLYRFDLHSNYTRLPLITPVYPGNPGYVFNSLSTIGVCEGRLRIARMFRDYEKLIVWQLDDGGKQDWDIVQEFDFSGPEEDSSAALSLYKLGLTHDMAFHPHDGDILYILVGMTSGRKDSSYIFMCNLKRKRLELMRKLPKYLWDSKLFPLVVPCWPTAVPRLQPQC